jgi:hypothetical protein
MTTPSPLDAARERETRVLFGVAGGLGCLLVVCIVTTLIAVGLALLWTAQDSLGPVGNLLLTQLPLA